MNPVDRSECGLSSANERLLPPSPNADIISSFVTPISSFHLKGRDVHPKIEVEIEVEVEEIAMVCYFASSIYLLWLFLDPLVIYVK